MWSPPRSGRAATRPTPSFPCPGARYLVAGDAFDGVKYNFALARYKTGGALDGSFGTGGLVTTAVGASHDFALALARQDDDKVVAAGYTTGADPDDFDFAVVRYNDDGSLDTDFGTGGIVVTAIGLHEDIAYALLIQPDGKILAAGFSNNDLDFDFALVRYNDDGSLDTSFGTGGIVTTPIGGGDDVIRSVALDSGGRIVVAGYTLGATYDVALARYDADGDLDPTFGTGGLVVTPVGTGHDFALALALLDDGRMAVAGHAAIGGSDDFMVLRYLDDGSLDPSFGTGGKVTTAVGAGSDVAAALAIQPDGKLVAVGAVEADGASDIGVARYDADGALDPSFGTDGVVITPIGASFDGANAAALLGDGRIVAAGFSFNGTDNDFAVVRYKGSICANGVHEPGEPCDDGNLLDGDCCSSSCRLDTAGTPCTSDGNVCTTDQCNASGTCTHPNNTAPCDDGIFCNGTDTCGGGTCHVHSGDPCTGECTSTCNEATESCFDPAGTACASDGNPCTDDRCDGTGTCTHPENTAPCDDGFFCNGPETCSGGACTVHAGDPCAGGADCADSCDEAADDCLSPAGTPCASDGNVCTDDRCNGSGTCTHPNNTAPCNDGFFCNGADTCSGGTCKIHAGDPCGGAPQCANTCNEAADNCFTPSGSACNDDGNACTSDTCNGSGACAHPPRAAGTVCRPVASPCDIAETCSGTGAPCPADSPLPNGTPCEDGSACTTNQTCTAGVCGGGLAVVCPLCERCDGVGGCQLGPQLSCRRPGVGRGEILLMHGPLGREDRLLWKWLKGAETKVSDLGDPMGGDDYALCVYEQGGASLFFKSTAPAASICGVQHCWGWQPRGSAPGPGAAPKGVRYADRYASNDGLKLIQVTTGATGRARIIVKGSAEALPFPNFSSVHLPLVIQLQHERANPGQCWEATYSTAGVVTNGAGIVRGHSN